MADVTKLLVAVWLLAAVALLVVGIALDNIWFLAAATGLGLGLLVAMET